MHQLFKTLSRLGIVCIVVSLVGASCSNDDTGALRFFGVRVVDGVVLAHVVHGEEWPVFEIELLGEWENYPTAVEIHLIDASKDLLLQGESVASIVDGVARFEGLSVAINEPIQDFRPVSFQVSIESPGSRQQFGGWGSVQLLPDPILVTSAASEGGIGPSGQLPDLDFQLVSSAGLLLPVEELWVEIEPPEVPWYLLGLSFSGQFESGVATVSGLGWVGGVPGEIILAAKVRAFPQLVTPVILGRYVLAEVNGGDDIEMDIHDSAESLCIFPETEIEFPIYAGWSGAGLIEYSWFTGMNLRIVEDEFQNGVEMFLLAGDPIHEISLLSSGTSEVGYGVSLNDYHILLVKIPEVGVPAGAEKLFRFELSLSSVALDHVLTDTIPIEGNVAYRCTQL